jgi:hypothetical protein
MIEVEEIALGQVLRKLNGMPGIARLHLDLGGPGGKRRKQTGSKTEDDGPRSGERPGRGETLARTIALLMQGPKTLDEITAELGGDRQRAHNATYLLRKKKFITKVRKTYKLTAKATAELRARGAAAPAALPSPSAPTGRMTPGRGPVMLRAALGKGPVARADLNARLAAHGVTPKSIPGVIDRGKRDRIIRKNGSQLYELTAKGKKIELPEAAAHG